MRKHLRIALILGLAGIAPVAAQDADEYVPTQGSASLGEAQSSGRGVVIGSRRRANYIPEIYTVRRGDTLWEITGRYYGNPYEWPRVWSYNPEVTNPHWIYPLDRLRLRGNDGTGAAIPVASNSQSTRSVPGSVWLRDQGFLDREALENTGVVIGSPEENMLLSTWDDVYVRYEEGARVQPGREYTIFREIDEEERSPDERGRLVRIFGTVRLRSYDPERGVGRATITEALDPIERGYRIAPIPRRFEMVPPRQNARDVEGRVVATLRPQRLIADQQVVFLNVGEEDGVEVGN
ncbi:MAG: LysM peptidoglycan-binding domain-containing protein, partial [Myxococcota bacterium]